MSTIYRQTRGALANRPVAAVLCALLGACGTGETDSRDDVGAPPDDDTRIELIFVDSVSDSLSDAQDGPLDALAGTSPPEVIPPAPTAADETGGDDLLTFDGDGDFTVQVGTFKESSRASRRVRELAALGYPAYTVSHPAGSQVRVRIGYFTTRDEADRFGLRFQRDHGGKYWIDRRVPVDVASR